MQVYMIENKAFGTLDDARAHVREIPKVFRADVLVLLVNVATDKLSVVLWLNNGAPVVQEVLRAWRGSARGALVPVET